MSTEVGGSVAARWAGPHCVCLRSSGGRHKNQRPAAHFYSDAELAHMCMYMYMCLCLSTAVWAQVPMARAKQVRALVARLGRHYELIRGRVRPQLAGDEADPRMAAREAERSMGSTAHRVASSGDAYGSTTASSVPTPTRTARIRALALQATAREGNSS